MTEMTAQLALRDERIHELEQQLAALHQQHPQQHPQHNPASIIGLPLPSPHKAGGEDSCQEAAAAAPVPSVQMQQQPAEEVLDQMEEGPAPQQEGGSSLEGKENWLGRRGRRTTRGGALQPHVLGEVGNQVCKEVYMLEPFFNGPLLGHCSCSLAAH